MGASELQRSERRSPIARWGQLAQDLRRSIELQEYLVGEQLPTELELAETYGVSRITVRQALASLTDDGYIQRKHGLGTFVSDGLKIIQHDLTVAQPWKDRVASSGMQAVSKQLPAPQHMDAPRSILLDVGVSKENVGRRYFRRIQVIDGTPLGYSESWLAPQIANGIETKPLKDGSLTRTLETDYDISPAVINSYMHAETAPADVAESLNCHLDDPLLVVNELALAADGSVISVSSTRWLGHRVRFHQEHIRGE